VSPARIGLIGYPTLVDAYAAAVAGSVIEAQAVTFSSPLTLNRSIAVTLRGGFDSDFKTRTGYTVNQGKLTVEKGSVVIDRITIR
jgi:hypothetical protein